MVVVVVVVADGLQRGVDVVIMSARVSVPWNTPKLTCSLVQ